MASVVVGLACLQQGIGDVHGALGVVLRQADLERAVEALNLTAHVHLAAQEVDVADLQRGGLSRAEIGKVEPLVVPPVNTEQSLRQKQIDVAVLGGILRDKALATGGVRIVFSDVEEAVAF